MTITNNIVLLAQALGNDVAQIIGKLGDLGSLSTTEKTNLVGALNELKSKLGNVENTANNAATIDDTTSSVSKTYSSTKVESLISTAINNLIDGAPAAYDTLKEIADYISSDSSATSALTTAIGKRVRFDAAQSLSAPEKAQACANIGVGDPAANFVNAYQSARDA